MILTKGKRKIGEIVTTSFGKVMVLNKTMNDIYREPIKGKRLGICLSMAEEKAALSLDEHILMLVAANKPDYIVFHLKKQSVKYAIKTEKFFDPKFYFSRRKSIKGALLRCVYIEHFTMSK